MAAAPSVCWASRLSGSTYLSDNHFFPLQGAGESLPLKMNVSHSKVGK